jgi:3-phosphoshikimate 1-carboxyvinyltransferase
MTEYLALAPLQHPIDARLRPPGSKSQTIRALVGAALAAGDSRLGHPLDSGDTRFARQALRQLGVEIEDSGESWAITGCIGRLQPADQPLDAGASGLSARCLIAIAPLVDGRTAIIGRDRLPERPMQGLIAALGQLGVEIESTDGHLPVTVFGQGRLPGGTVEVDSHQTTQFLTGLLMASPLATDSLTIVPIGLEGARGYVEVTLRMMEDLGAMVHPVNGGFRVEPTGYVGSEIDIEPDASAAVYPMVAAAITGGRVVIDGLGSGSLQPDLVIAGVLERMGCLVERAPDHTSITGPEDRLSAIDVDLAGSPDGSLAVAVACLLADGESRLRGLGSLRFKESDRLAALAIEIERLGSGAVVAGDDLLITPGALRPGRVETYEDHRVAMSFGLLGLVTEGIEIANPSVVGKTWPHYWEMLENLGRENP